jgi:uncharacterized DUF497 family protein
MTDDEFEWDDAKATANLAKHRVSFEAARLVFQDAFSVEEPEVGIAYGEERFIIMGMANGELLTVVYTERGDRIRIISARKATRRERHDYYQNQATE